LSSLLRRKAENRSAARQFVVGYLAQKARSFFGLAFFSMATNEFCCY
jgi:hypothetical protein